MALFSECRPQCAQTVLDTADIVRDGDFSPTGSPTGKDTAAYNHCFRFSKHTIRFPSLLASALKSEDTKQNLSRHSNTPLGKRISPMKQFFTNLRQTAIAGFFFFSPSTLSSS